MPQEHYRQEAVAHHYEGRDGGDGAGVGKVSRQKVESRQLAFQHIRYFTFDSYSPYLK